MINLNWISVKEWSDSVKQYVPDYEDYYGTYKAKIGIIDINSIKNFKGYNGENPSFDEANNFFGKYPLRRWDEFVEDIKINGIKEPIEVIIKGAEGYILNGNHRLKVALQLKLQEVPVLIKYCK